MRMILIFILGSFMVVAGCGSAVTIGDAGSGTAGDAKMGADAAGTADPTRPALKSVRYWAYQNNAIEVPGSVDALAASHYDMLVIDPARTNWTGADQWAFDTAGMVKRLKASPAHDGVHRKLVIAYVSLGEAEKRRWYWTWPSGQWTLSQFKNGVPRPASWPDFFIAPDPDGWAGAYTVAYWNPAWKNIVITGAGLSSAAHAGNYSSMVDEAVRDGFDGIYLDWVEAFSNKVVIAAAKKVNLDPAVEMIRLLGEVRAYARLRDPGFLVLQQNAPDLAAGHPELFSNVDGIGQEDIWYVNSDAAWTDPSGYDQPQSAMQTQQYFVDLAPFVAAGVPVFSMDYAVQNAPAVYQKALAKGLVPYCSRSALSQLSTTPPPGY